ncbi:unnamed protein product [Periconia digitata]|uniref:Uncharacterized protein n=1 Tax=Periconia digitata TaxID=1303443 RepID=A0A9W4UP44_9PLEO|nr:unnamed protein product [Periconia digitata]
MVGCSIRNAQSTKGSQTLKKQQFCGSWQHLPCNNNNRFFLPILYLLALILLPFPFLLLSTTPFNARHHAQSPTKTLVRARRLPGGQHVIIPPPPLLLPQLLVP